MKGRPLALLTVHVAALALAIAGQRDFVQGWAPLAWIAAACVGLVLWWTSGKALDGIDRETARTGERAVAPIHDPTVLRSGVLLIGLVVLALGMRDLEADLASPRGGALWLAGLLAVAVSLASSGRPHGRRRPSRAEIGSVAVLALVALSLRVVDLSGLPADVNNDEGEHADSGLNIVHGQPLHPGVPAVPASAFQTGWQTEPTGGHWLLGVVMQVVGEDVFGMRLTAALSGVACVLFLYLLLRDWVRPSAAIASAFLLAVGHVQLFWSRTGFLQATVAALSTAVVWLVLRGLRRGGSTPFVAAGLLLGLAQYVYWSARVLLVILAVFGLYLLLKQRHLLRRRLAGFALMGALFLLAVAPLALWSARNPETLLARGRGVLILANRPYLDAHFPGQGAAEVTAAQLQRALVGFAQTGDGSRAFYRAAAPLLDPVTASLLLLGLLGFTLQWRRPERILVSLWLWLPLLTFCGLTLDPPPTQRLLFLFPAFYFVAGVVLDRLAALALASGPAALGLSRIAAALLLAYSAYWNHEVFFVEYRAAWPARMWTAIARRMVQAGPSHKTYLVSPPSLYAFNSTIRFIARGLQAANLRPNEIPVQERGDHHALFIVSPSFADTLPRLRDAYPGGEEVEHRDAKGALMFTAYRVDAARFAEPADPSAPRRSVAQRIGLVGSAPGRVRSPRGLAAGTGGRIYVADTGNDRIQVYADDGTPVMEITGDGTPGGRLQDPWAVALAGTGEVDVLERASRRLRRFGADGAWLADIPLDAIADPVAIAIAPDGTRALADAGGHQLLLLPPNGERRLLGGRGTAPGSLDRPVALAFGHDGSLYVAELGNQRVQHLGADFAPLAQWSLPPTKTHVPALVGDPDGGVWVAHPGGAAVHHYDAEGAKRTAVGSEGGEPDALVSVGALALASNGDLLVLDLKRQQVWRFRR